MDRIEMTIITDIANEEIRDTLLLQYKKSKARKPTDTWENDIEGRRKHLNRWACPECGSFLGFGNAYCTDCGTKLQWG